MNVDNFGYSNISPLQSEKFRASHAVASNYAIDDIDDIDDEDGGYVLIIDPRRLRQGVPVAMPVVVQSCDEYPNG